MVVIKEFLYLILKIYLISCAFVKEPDGDQREDNIPEKHQSEHPDYMTLHGLEEIKKYCNALGHRQLGDL